MPSKKKTVAKATPKKSSSVFPGDHIITSSRLIRIMQDSIQNGSRFCFILGSGASVESGILSGMALERAWMDCLMGVSKDRDTEPFSPNETRELAKKLRENGRLQYDFADIEANWENARKNNRSMDSRYYFDIFKLRFYPDKKLGFRYLEKIMENAQPSLGYHTLALILAEDKGNNLVVTLNFDSLVEDSLYLYTNKKPLVINHELLADYLDCNAVTRPLIAKLHHGLFFDPINDTKELPKNWKKSWQEILKYVFYTYTPIVIGYGGGDNSLMEILKDKQIPIRNGMYWCTRDNPLEEDFNDDIRKLVKARNGHFVLIDGFDSLMLEMGKVFFDGQIEPDATKELWDQQVKERLDKYEKQYKNLRSNKEIITLNVVKDAQEFVDMGFSCFLNDDFEEALIYLDKAIELDPTNSEAYRIRGHIWTEIDKRELAIDDYSTAITYDPDNEDLFGFRGLAYYDSDKYQEAIDDYTKVLTMNPYEIFIYNSRGNAWMELSNYGNAITDYSKAIELHPTYALAYRNRADAYDALGQPDLAEADRKTADELEGKTT